MRRVLVALAIAVVPLTAQSSDWVTFHEVLLAPGQSLDLDTGMIGTRTTEMQGAELRFDRRARGPALIIPGPGADGDTTLTPTQSRRGEFSWSEVTETSNVSELHIRNDSGRHVLLLEGDIIEGGRQNRVINTTFVVNTKKPAHRERNNFSQGHGL